MGLCDDLRYACRSLRRSPGLSLTVILTLAIGIGLNTAIFSVVRGVLLKPLAFRDAGRLVRVSGRLARHDGRPVLLSGGTFHRTPAGVAAFEDVAAVATIRQNLRGTELPVQVQVGWVSPNFFSLLGVQPELGRPFERDEPPGAVMLSHGAWRRLFAEDPTIVGRAITLDGRSYAVTGIVPASFALELPSLPRDIDVWKVPDTWWQNGDVWNADGRGPGLLQFVCRIAPDVPVARARAQLAAFTAAERELDAQSAADGLELVMTPLQGAIVGETKPILLTLVGAVTCVLLIACANVMNLLLVRADARRRDLAVRLALGSSRGRLMRVLVLESALMSLAGGAAGCAAAAVAVRFLVALRPVGLPRVDGIAVDGGVLTFAAAIALSCPIIAVLPAFVASRRALRDDLHDTRGATRSGQTRASHIIVVGQFAGSLVLLVGAALLGTSLVRLHLIQPGFNAAQLLTFSVSLPGTRYQRPAGSPATNAPETGRFVRALEERIETLPGVQSVGTVWPLPLSGRHWAGSFVAGSGADGPRGLADYRLATPHLFDALGGRLLEGRTFRGDDRRAVTIVSRRFARQAWPNQSAIGRVVQASPWGGPLIPFEVVGVADDVRYESVRSEPAPTLYFDSMGWSWTDWEMNVVVRTPQPEALVEPIRTVLAQLDREIPMAEIRPMTAYVADDFAANRFTLVLIGGFATVALFLAVLGLYGVISYAVSRRAREFGIRMALGAGHDGIVRMVLAEGARLAGVGIGVGLLGALWLTDLLAGLLFGTRPHEPLALAGVAALLAGVSLAASYLPARRAARLQLTEILRAE